MNVSGLLERWRSLELREHLRISPMRFLRPSQFESDLLSFILFDGDFAQELISLGRHDAHQRADEVMSFFNA